MSVWFSLFLSVFLVGGLFFSLYMLINLLVGGKRASSNPKLGVVKGEKEGTLGFWVNWNPSMFALQFYRIRINHYSPASDVKEGIYTFTFEPPRKAPFIQYVDVPEDLKELLTSGQVGRKAIITVEARTADGYTVPKDYYLADLKKIYLGQKSKKVPSKLEKFDTMAEDLPPVASLDFDELVERKKKLKSLSEAAKAKAAKAAAPKPAAAPAPAPEAAVADKT